MSYWRNNWASPNDSSAFAYGVQYPTQGACEKATYDRGYSPSYYPFCSYVDTTPAPQALPEPVIVTPEPPIPGITLLDEKGIDPKIIIIAVIAFILLLRS